MNFLKCLASVLVTSCAAAFFTPACTSFAEAPPSPQELKEAEEQRQAEIEKLEFAMKAARKNLSNAIARKNVEEAKICQQSIREFQQSIRELRRRDLSAFVKESRFQKDLEEIQAQRQKEHAERQLEVMARPKIQPDTMKIGSRGFLQTESGHEYRLKVLFVNDEGVVARVGNKGLGLVITGVKRENLVTDRWFSLEQQVEVTGTQQFLDSKAGEVSFFVLKPVDPMENEVGLRESPKEFQPLPPLSTERVRVPPTFRP